MTKPTKIKRLQGTMKPSREMKNEMVPPEADVSDVPHGLINETAQKEWLKTTGILSDLNMLHETDLTMLLSYCNEMAKYFACIEKIKEFGDGNYIEGMVFKTPNGHFMPRPEVSEGNRALANAIKLSSLFGFNPAARTKIEMPEQKKKDPFSEL